MERRRNRPEKYDRELVHKTVKAIKKARELAAPAPPNAELSPGRLGWVQLCGGCHEATAMQVPRLTSPTSMQVTEIRKARQDRFYEARMSKAREQQAVADRKQLEQEIHLVRAPGALAKDKAAKLAAKQKQKGEAGWGRGWRGAAGGARVVGRCVYVGGCLHVLLGSFCLMPTFLFAAALQWLWRCRRSR